jgi:hypothetical protein
MAQPRPGACAGCPLSGSRRSLKSANILIESDPASRRRGRRPRRGPSARTRARRCNGWRRWRAARERIEIIVAVASGPRRRAVAGSGAIGSAYLDSLRLVGSDQRGAAGDVHICRHKLGRKNEHGRENERAAIRRKKRPGGNYRGKPVPPGQLPEKSLRGEVLRTTACCAKMRYEGSVGIYLGRYPNRYQKG